MPHIMEEKMCFSRHPELGFLVPGENFLLRISVPSQALVFEVTLEKLELDCSMELPMCQVPVFFTQSQMTMLGQV